MFTVKYVSYSAEASPPHRSLRDSVGRIRNRYETSEHETSVFGHSLRLLQRPFLSAHAGPTAGYRLLFDYLLPQLSFRALLRFAPRWCPASRHLIRSSYPLWNLTSFAPLFRPLRPLRPFTPDQHQRQQHYIER